MDVRRRWSYGELSEIARVGVMLGDWGTVESAASWLQLLEQVGGERISGTITFHGMDNYEHIWEEV